MELCPSDAANPAFSNDALNSTLYEPRSLKVTVYQDPSCAWCYVGEREMEKALDSLREKEEDVRINIEFKPFIVDPSLPVDRPVDMREMYCSKYGARRWAQMQQLVISRGAACGIDFKMGGTTRSPLLGQRLIMRAGQLGGGEAQKKLIEEISRRVFEQEKDIGCLGVLSESAAASGLMCKEQAIAFLTSHQLESEVEQEMKDARKRGINGVPFAVINDKWAVSGGQSADIYLDVFTKVLRNEVSGPIATN